MTERFIYSIHHIPYGDRNMPDKVAVRIGSGGRVVIPKDYLREKGIKEGDIALVSLSKAKVEEATGRDLSE
ncbi:hypothetical protein DRN72_04835 [Methanosarcinales archaeon]|nr:MAG: hypothetical protein DRN72_04835 [Methanosarcinales archaeon]